MSLPDPDRRHIFASRSRGAWVESSSRFSRRSVNFGIVGVGTTRRILGYGPSLKHLNSMCAFPKGDAEPWACTTCTFLNVDSLHLMCDVCGTERLEYDDVAELREDFVSRGRQKSFVIESLSKSFVADMDKQAEILMAFEEKARKKVRMEELIDCHKLAMNEIAENPCSCEKVDFSFDELERAKKTLSESRGRVQSLQAVHFTEKEDQDAMSEFLQQRKSVIEEAEGTPIEECTGKASRPGVCRVSREALEWVAQKRMLEDWKGQWEERDQEIKALLEQEQMIVEQWKRNYAISL
jgi:hypothetical protein